MSGHCSSLRKSINFMFSAMGKSAGRRVLWVLGEMTTASVCPVYGKKGEKVSPVKYYCYNISEKLITILHFKCYVQYKFY